ncbi:MAG: STAS domain-containing protein [Spirochaetaceae bacterium]|jgi:anti-anti-sigma factor|nr:STAS domain-containing protein [Spirochaetaceae bacterium]
MNIFYHENTDYKKTDHEKTGERILLAKVTGDCDLYSSRELYAGVTGKMKDGFNRAVLDLSGVAYLDSSGVGAIIRIIKLAKENQITLRFRGIAGTPRKVLEMSNILSLIVEEP